MLSPLRLTATSTLRAIRRAAPCERAGLMARLKSLSKGPQTTHGAYEKR